MPTIAYVAVGVLTLILVLIVAAWTLLQLQVRRLKRQLGRLVQELEKSAREDAAAEERIKTLLGYGVGLRAVNGESKREKRRRLWLVPVVAVLAGAGWLAGLIRHHPHQVWAGAGAAVSAALLTLMMVTGAGGSQHAQTPTPVIVPSRAPSSLTSLPSPGPVTTTPSPGDGTRTTSEARLSGTTQPLMPPTTATLTDSVPPTSGTDTGVVPPTSVTLPTREPCLLGVGLLGLDVCVG